MNVKIYKPSTSVMQSGRGKTQYWVLEYETTTPRAPERLMGWTASGDTLNQVQMRFESAEKAVAFAKEKGWTYDVLPEHERRVKPRNYGDNFRYIPSRKEERA